MEVEKLATLPLHNGDLIVVHLDLSADPGIVQTTVHGIDCALRSAVQATAAVNCGIAILDRGTNLEILDTDKLAALGLQRIPAEVAEVEEGDQAS